MDIDAVYTAIKDAVDDAALEGTTLNVTALDTIPMGHVPVPCFFLGEYTMTPHRTMGTTLKPAGMVELQIDGHLLLSQADNDEGQREGRRLSGTGQDTILTAIEAARGAPGESALGGAADDLYVRVVRGNSIWTAGDVQFVACEFAIFVIGS